MYTPPDPRRWRALALLGVAFFMVILDGTIVYVALPPIGAELGFSAGGLQWVMSAYLLSFGGLLLLGGRAADLLGRRRIFMIGVSLFAGSSLLCGLAWSAEVLVTARVAQGAAAAIMAPTALSLVMITFAEGPERNKALGIWGAIGGIGATSGLLIGGPVTGWLGWEWVFFINVPVGIGVVALTPLLVRESHEHVGRRIFDLAGGVTITTVLVLLVYAVAEAPAAGWAAAQTIGLVALSVTLIAVFLLVEARSAAPLVPLRMLHSRKLMGGNLVLFTTGMAVDGLLFTLTLYAQHVLGYSALQFGLSVAVMTLMSVVGACTGQALVTRIGFRPVATGGMALLMVGSLVLTRVSVDGTFLDDLVFGLLIFGAGLGAAFVASQIAALAGVKEVESGLAAALVDTSFTLGGALGLAVVSTVAASASVGQAGQPQLAITEGAQSAFVVAAGFAGLGLLSALVLFRRDPVTHHPHEHVIPTATKGGY